MAMRAKETPCFCPCLMGCSQSAQPVFMWCRKRDRPTLYMAPNIRLEDHQDVHGPRQRDLVAPWITWNGPSRVGEALETVCVSAINSLVASRPERRGRGQQEVVKQTARRVFSITAELPIRGPTICWANSKHKRPSNRVTAKALT